MRNAQYRIWIMARKLKKVENEKHTMQELKYGEKTDQKRNIKTNTAGHGIWQEN